MGPGKCATCHSNAGGNPGGINCETYASVKEYGSQMMGAIDSGRMPKPPAAPLTSAQKDVLRMWIQVGMPMNEVTVNPDPTPSSSPSPTPPAWVPVYGDVADLIFTPRCVHCHSDANPNDHGGINLETYDSVKMNLADVLGEVEGGTMPPKPNHPLDAADRVFLRAWANGGAPKGDDPYPVPSASPSPLPPLAPTFTSIEANIFKPRCIGCHKAGQGVDGIPLDNLKNLINSDKSLVVPSQPQESWMMYMLTRTDSKQMPPVKAGGALQPVEIETIRKWIELGAPN